MTYVDADRAPLDSDARRPRAQPAAYSASAGLHPVRPTAGAHCAVRRHRSPVPGHVTVTVTPPDRSDRRPRDPGLPRTDGKPALTSETFARSRCRAHHRAGTATLTVEIQPDADAGGPDGTPDTEDDEVTSRTG